MESIDESSVRLEHDFHHGRYRLSHNDCAKGAGFGKQAITFDLTILCGSRKFFVHKAIVCPRSDFVNAAVKNFREGVTGTIALEEADEIVVEKLVEYLYTLDYDDGRDFGLSTGLLDEHDLGNLFQLPATDKVDPAEIKSLTYMDALHLAINLGVAADRFFARALNDLVLSKFQSAVDHAAHHYSVDQAMEVIMTVYGNTRPDDRMRASIKA